MLEPACLISKDEKLISEEKGFRISISELNKGLGSEIFRMSSLLYKLDGE